MRSARITAAGITVLLTAGLVAGCTSAPTEGASTPAATPVATSTPDATSTSDTTPAAGETTAPEDTAPAAPQDFEVGARITAEQAETLPEDAKAYPMADDTLVVVKREAKLPKAVRKDIAKQIAEGFVPTEGITTASAAKETATRASQQTGKHIIVVTQKMGMLTKQGEPQLLWSSYASPKPANIKSAVSFDEHLANVKAFIAKQKNPAEWAYVVMAG